jgi:hypothetical protein
MSTIKVKRFNTKTKQGRLFRALVTNREVLSESEISHRFSIKNPTATISAIRQSGYAVYAKTRKAGNGVMVTEYKHGEANREIVAAGYKALSLGLV